MVAVAAIDPGTQELGRHAKLFALMDADGAVAAPDPRKGDARIAHLNVPRIGSDGFDHAYDLMAER